MQKQNFSNSVLHYFCIQKYKAQSSVFSIVQILSESALNISSISYHLHALLYNCQIIFVFSANTKISIALIMSAFQA